MAERTEELTEEASDDADGYEDPEARAAMAEAQSVIDRVQSGDTDEAEGSEPVAAPDERTTTPRESDESGGRLPSIPRPSLPSLSTPSMPATGDLFSKWSFAGVLAATLVGLAAGNLLLPLGPLGGAVGVLVAAFAFGLVNPRRAYLESTLVFATLGAVTAFFGNVSVAVATDRGVPIVAVGAAIVLLAGLVGYYFGRDLRAGLSRDVP